MRTKTICFSVLTLFISLITHAQLNFGQANSVRPAVEQVLSMYSNHFAAIRGDTISAAANSLVFKSTIQPEGAIACTLTYNITEDGLPDYSWQATMYASDDFKAAARRYTACCQQLKNILLSTGNGSCKMKGEYDQPNETKNFYSTVLIPDTKDEVLGRLRLEVLLEGDMTEWKLSILIYDSVHNDKEGSLINGR